MHLIWFGKGILDLHGFSTALSLAIVIGALYGLVRLFVDLIRFVERNRVRPTSPPVPPAPATLPRRRFPADDV